MPGTGLLVLLLGLAACGPPRPVQRAGWQGAEHDVAALLRADPTGLLQLQDLTAEVRFRLHQVGSASGSILYSPPARMRLDVRGPLFGHILSAVIDGDLLTAVSGGRTYYVPAQDGLDAFLQIDLAGYDPRLVLLGVIAPPQRGIVSTDYPRADRVRLQIDDGVDGQRRWLWIDLHHGFVEREEIVDTSGQTVWMRRMTQWRAVGPLYLPAEIRVESGDRALELSYGDIALDRELSDTVFYSGITDPPQADDLTDEHPDRQSE